MKKVSQSANTSTTLEQRGASNALPVSSGLSSVTIERLQEIEGVKASLSHNRIILLQLRAKRDACKARIDELDIMIKQIEYNNLMISKSLEQGSGCDHSEVL